jgi:hypothetical protein
MVNAGFGLDELAIEAGLRERQRPKPGPLSAATCSSAPAPSAWGPPGELVARKIAVVITGPCADHRRQGYRAQVMLAVGSGFRWR